MQVVAGVNVPAKNIAGFMSTRGDLFGVDVRWGGAIGNRRATTVARLLEKAGIRGRLTQSLDGAWEVRVGPIPGGDVARVIDQFVW
jgi:hypothetical protein